MILFAAQICNTHTAKNAATVAAWILLAGEIFIRHPIGKSAVNIGISHPLLSHISEHEDSAKIMKIKFTIRIVVFSPPLCTKIDDGEPRRPTNHSVPAAYR